jgi:hypothetical protein
MAWRVRLEGGLADWRSLVVPTLAEVFHWYEPRIRHRSTCPTCPSKVRSPTATTAAGYHLESLAVSVVVRLVRRYLADYRELLYQDADCRSALQRILDIFVSVGWPDARRLTFQLDDIFR